MEGGGISKQTPSKWLAVNNRYRNLSKKAYEYMSFQQRHASGCSFQNTPTEKGNNEANLNFTLRQTRK